MQRWNGTRRKLSDAVAEYVAYAADNHKPATVENKAISLRRMVRVLEGATMAHAVTPQDMTAVWLECGKTRSNNSRIVDHQAYKHFFAWCEEMGYRPHFSSPFKHIKAPKPVYKERRRVPVEQFEDLKTAASESPRDRLYISKGLYSLCRKVEMYHIRWDDIDREAGTMAFFRHKTGEPDTLAISDEFETELEYYEDWYKFVTDTPKNKPLEPSWFLTPRFTRPQFVGNKDWVRGYIRPDIMMGRQTGGKLVVRALNEIGFPTRDALTDTALREGAHTLRRSGARALYDAEVEAGNPKALRHVQLQLGHKTEDQTQKYIGYHVDREERNERIRGKVMYPKARAVLEEKREIERGGLRLIVS